VLSGVGRALWPPGPVHLVFEVGLLADLHHMHEGFAVLQLAAAALVDAELGINHVAVFLQQPIGAVRRHVAALLVGGQREHDVAVRHEALALELRQHRDVAGRHRLVVDRPSRSEDAVALFQLERIGFPVVALRLDDVDMRQQQHRPLVPVALEARQQVALAREGLHQRDLVGPEAGSQQAITHQRRDLGGATAGMGRIDLDDLLIDRAKVQRVRGTRLRARGDGERSQHTQMRKTQR
jgi:hypothetical protein